MLNNCSHNYTLTISMCSKTNLQCIGKEQCESLQKVARYISFEDNSSADFVHNSLVKYERGMRFLIEDVAKHGDFESLKEFVTIDIMMVNRSSVSSSQLPDYYREFVRVYMDTSTGYVRRNYDNLMKAIVYIENEMRLSGIPVPIPSESLVTWW